MTTDTIQYESELLPSWLNPIDVIKKSSSAKITVLDHTATRYVIEADRPIESNLVAMFELSEIEP